MGFAVEAQRLPDRLDKSEQRTMDTGSAPAEVTPGGSYEAARFNALRHGVLSRYTVLPWEDEAEYQALLAALVREHTPQGPTEEHLIEELAGIIWRKRRLRLSEAVSFRRGLHCALDPLDPFRDVGKVALVHLYAGVNAGSLGDAIRATAKDTDDAISGIKKNEALTRRALDVLGSRQKDAYEAALAVLCHDTRDWWADTLDCDPDDLEEDEQPATADAEGLRRFLESEVLPWFTARQKELANRPLIREQAFGEAVDPEKLERLCRYEVHLDRKLERTLSMLLRLQDLRRRPAE